MCRSHPGIYIDSQCWCHSTAQLVDIEVFMPWNEDVIELDNKKKPFYYVRRIGFDALPDFHSAFLKLFLSISSH